MYEADDNCKSFHRRIKLLDGVQVGKIPEWVVNVQEFIEDTLEQKSQEFCDYHRVDEFPATINFCQLANDAGIQCPQEDAYKDICVTIW